MVVKEEITDKTVNDFIADKGNPGALLILHRDGITRMWPNTSLEILYDSPLTE